MATEPLAGGRMTKVTERRTKTDWARFNHVPRCTAQLGGRGIAKRSGSAPISNFLDELRRAPAKACAGVA